MRIRTAILAALAGAAAIYLFDPEKEPRGENASGRRSQDHPATLVPGGRRAASGAWRRSHRILSTPQTLEFPPPTAAASIRRPTEDVGGSSAPAMRRTFASPDRFESGSKNDPILVRTTS